MDSLRQLIDESILEHSKQRFLPAGSTRQMVRGELFKRAYTEMNARFTNGRQEKRGLARTIAKDLWKRGERLVERKDL